ncbi:MAG: hypothetical protein RL021_2087 [Bacteroidota bacterium]
MFRVLLFLTLLLASAPASHAVRTTGEATPAPIFPRQVRYVENLGQWESVVRYRADFRGGHLFLEDTGFTFLFEHPDDRRALHPPSINPPLRFRYHAVRLFPLGASSPKLVPADTAAYHHNYFLGNDPSRWASNVKLFTSVTYRELYPGIDLTFYSSLNDIKYDFIVHPGASPARIRLDYRGADRLVIENGELHIHTSVGTMTLQRPYAFQRINDREIPVPCDFVLRKGILTFAFPKGYDPGHTLVIDPTLVFSSYTGSTSDNWGFTATYDANGNLYAGGNVDGVGYPVTTGAYQVAYGSGSGLGNGFPCDMAIAKFNAAGTSLLYATFIGGSDNEQPQSLIVDEQQRLVIYGTTTSATFPVTPGAYRTTLTGMTDIVVSKLSENGDSLIASTFVGGTGEDGLNTTSSFTGTGPLKYNYSDESRGEIITNAGTYIIGSCTRSSDFPVTSGCIQSAPAGIQDGVVFCLNNDLSVLQWSTYLGGSGEDAVYDVLSGANGLYVAGGTNSTNFPVTAGTLHTTYNGGRADGFIARIGGNGASLLASTYIGTSAYDQTYFVETDGAGDIYTTGQTEGSYPITAGAYSNPNSGQFIHKMDANLTTTSFSTVFGSGAGTPNISPTAFLVDTCRNMYVAGWGRCLNPGNVFVPGDNFGMPVTSDAYQSTTDGCDFYFIVLNASASGLLYATYFGGVSSTEHVDGGTSRFDKNGVIYESVCAGCGGNSDFPTTPGVVSNTNNSSNCNNGVIKLAFQVSRPLAATAATPAAGCAPLTVTFNNSSINAESFVWDFDDGTTGDTSRNPVHVFTVPGTYQVRLIALNASTCAGSDTAYVTVDVSAGIVPDASFAVNTDLSCDSLSGFATYNGTGGSIFSWQIDNGIPYTGLSIPFSFTDTGFHQVVLVVSDSVCPVAPDTAFQTLYFPPPVVAAGSAVADGNPCLPDVVQFSATGVATYKWDFGDGSPTSSANNIQHTYTVPGTYYALLIAEDTTSCNQRDTVVFIIDVADPIPLDTLFIYNLPAQCDSFGVQFISNTAPGTVSLWQMGDGTTNSEASFTHTYPGPGLYSVAHTVIDTICNRQATSTQLVLLQPSVSAVINAADDTAGCVPFTLDLSNTTASTGTYQWNPGNGSVVSGTQLSLTYTQPGDYVLSLSVTDNQSCNQQASDTLRVAVYAPTVSGFETSSFSGYDFTEVTLTDRSIRADSLWWELGDGTTSTDRIVVHRYSSPGIYTICLYTVTSDGCTDSSCTDVEQPPVESLFLPNCFTPNGDGKNEVFKVETVGILELNIRIYNRWGRVIHEFNTVDGFWDGTVEGVPAQEAVYVYQLQAVGVVSGAMERTGRVTLLR